MWDLPTHCQIGVTKDGEGPLDQLHPDFDHWECWCGEPYPCPVEALDPAIFERCLTGVLYAIDRAEKNDLSARNLVQAFFEAKYGVVIGGTEASSLPEVPTAEG